MACVSDRIALKFVVVKMGHSYPTNHVNRQLDLFVVAPSARKLYQRLGQDFSAKEPNIWAGLLANSARSKGYGVGLFDHEIEN